MTAEIRELLELAAQAAGYEHRWFLATDPLSGDEYRVFQVFDTESQDWVDWNPRESGDDLIDLKSKLGINDIWCGDQVVCTIPEMRYAAGELFSDHPTRKAALAMAVVRCAAEYQRRKG